jgi:hypothetical protein
MLNTQTQPKGFTYRIDYSCGEARNQTRFIHGAVCAKHARLMFRDIPWMTLAIINSNKRVG